MARRKVKEILTLVEERIERPEPDNYVIVAYTADYNEDFKAATQAGISEDLIYMGFDVIGPGATSQFVANTLEERKAAGYSVHEINGRPVGLSILTPNGFKRKVLGGV